MMFDQPPVWTAPIANVSAWFVWPAISAVMSFVALMATIKLADRSRREARRKEYSVLLGLAASLETVLGVYEGMYRRMTANTYKIELRAASEVAMVPHFSEVLDQLKLTDIPTPSSAETFVSVRAWMRRMPKWLEDWEKEDFVVAKKDLRHQLKYLRHFQSIFESEAELVMTEFSWRHRFMRSIKSLKTWSLAKLSTLIQRARSR
ncbi:hypothetical protein BrevBR_08840 [Brevundimonas sp. BR2-1]|uniref:hypothetical protein n=1 Tax=Brevundimonas sp. BR2-1 TaxID=3031123 RepID=UPI0030A59922